jgi:hypothetical protein
LIENEINNVIADFEKGVSFDLLAKWYYFNRFISEIDGDINIISSFRSELSSNNGSTTSSNFIREMFFELWINNMKIGK